MKIGGRTWEPTDNPCAARRRDSMISRAASQFPHCRAWLSNREQRPVSAGGTVQHRRGGLGLDPDHRDTKTGWPRQIMGGGHESYGAKLNGDGDGYRQYPELCPSRVVGSSAAAGLSPCCSARRSRRRSSCHDKVGACYPFWRPATSASAALIAVTTATEPPPEPTVSLISEVSGQILWI